MTNIFDEPEAGPQQPPVPLQAQPQPVAASQGKKMPWYFFVALVIALFALLGWLFGFPLLNPIMANFGKFVVVVMSGNSWTNSGYVLALFGSLLFAIGVFLGSRRG